MRERPPNQYDSNLWELRFDEETGKPKGTPRRLTDWTGFYFGNPELTCRWKPFRLSERKSSKATSISASWPMGEAS